jgi:hypothetical protein
MVTTDDRLVDEYVKSLERELADIPRGKRREIIQEIREHIHEARAIGDGGTEADLRNLLDRLGDPAEIAAEARDRFGIHPKRPGAMEVVTVILLLVGGVLVPVVGWIIGVVLLWLSETWTTRDKLIGTLVVPGGLTGAFFFALYGGTTHACGELFNGAGHLISTTCTAGPSLLHQILAIGGFALLVILPVSTTIYLGGRLRRARAQR